MTHATLLPPGWPRPRGYANGIAAEGRLVLTGGVIGWDEHERLVGDTLASQFGQVLRNTLAILAEGGAAAGHIVRMTWYITSRDDYLAELPAIGSAWRETIGRHYPAIAVVQVAGLVERGARIEIETTAVVGTDDMQG